MTNAPTADAVEDLPVEELMIRAAEALPVRLERLDVALKSFGAAFGPALSEQGLGDVVSWLEKVSYVTCGEAIPKGDGTYAVAEALPWSGVYYVRMDSVVMTGLLDRLLPSIPEEGSSARQLSPIERRIGFRILDRAIITLTKELSTIRKLSGRALELKDVLEDGDLGAADGRCVVAEVGLDLDGTVGTMHVIMPFALFGPDTDMLTRPVRSQLVPKAGGWREEMSSKITSADVSVSAVLGRGKVRLRDAIAWQPGSTLDLGFEASQPVRVCVGGRAIFLGAAGRRANETMAIKISEELEKGEVKDR